MVTKKNAPTLFPRRASSKVMLADRSYELKLVEVSDDDFDKTASPVSPLIAMKAKKLAQKVTKKPTPKKTTRTLVKKRRSS